MTEAELGVQKDSPGRAWKSSKILIPYFLPQLIALRKYVHDTPSRYGSSACFSMAQKPMGILLIRAHFYSYCDRSCRYRPASA